MTTTDAAKLREAAEDCLTKAKYFPLFAGSSELLARHVLATVPEDGEVDESFWESLGAKREDCGSLVLRKKDNAIVFCAYLHCGVWLLSCDSTHISVEELPVGRISEVYQIFAALGIQPTKTDSKL